MKNQNYQNIKTFSDACIAVGINEELFYQRHDYLSNYLLNTAKLEIINRAINGEWIPDWTNSNEYKYYCWFDMSASSGFGFSDSDYDYVSSYSDVGSRLCYETREQAIYTTKQFIDEYKSVYIINKNEPSLNKLYSGEEEIKNSIIKNFDYETIKTYEDACEKLGMSSKNPIVLNILPELKKATIAHYKLMVIFKAINNGWIPNWGDTNEYKYYPYKEFASSGLGFSGSCCACHFSYSFSVVGSRLCTYSSDISNYITEQFNGLYLDLFCINNEEINSHITVEDMEKIHSIACVIWKEKIISLTNEYKDKNPFVNRVYLPEKIKNEMLKAFTAEQLPIVKKIFKKIE